MIDSHCHLDQAPILENLKEIILRSKKEGIEKILTICTTLKSYQNILSIVETDDIIYGTFGIHPHETNNDKIGKKQIIEKISINNKIIGVGETGLDFYYNNSDKGSQIESFENHIEAAIEQNIPLIVHSRNAESETYDILKNKYSDNLKILMHCFTGSTSFSKNLLKLNAYFSASGIITFKNSLELQETFKQVPLDNLLIETDSPFLSPVPMRGKKNEPSFIKYTLEKLALLKNIENFKLDKITSDNFNKLFFS
tara:strand:- start:357 stop:1118 length:762 start_codon:yes stop_codon:yes gene_type:complete